VNGLIQRQLESVAHMKGRTMMRKTMVLGSMFLSLSILAPYGSADEGTTQGTGTHLKVSGVVSKVQSGLTTIKTSWGP